MPARPVPCKVLQVDELHVYVYETRGEMGLAAALDVAAAMRRILAERPARMIFAAAPSQNELLAELAAMDGLNWGRVEAFHMDEYVGLPENAPQRFGYFLRLHLFDMVHPGRVEYMNGNAPDPAAECRRYAALLAERPVDIVCAGIGENGHMAFNDPHVADFDDPQTVKVVTLDQVCRLQQVHDGAFPTLDAVPDRALTVTMPALMAAQQIFCVVPGPTKAEAVFKTLRGPIGEHCPATAMRRHPQATLYLDVASAAHIL
ncbi:MAG: glucosamine-6-phosphate deaminase [Chloroflexi bacterium]|nr:glucosamine-6-phosphate deaminase [Chloroflexota bacterium]